MTFKEEHVFEYILISVNRDQRSDLNGNANIAS